MDDTAIHMHLSKVFDIINMCIMCIMCDMCHLISIICHLMCRTHHLIKIFYRKASVSDTNTHHIS